MEDKEENNSIKQLFKKNEGNEDAILNEIFLNNLDRDYSKTNYWFPSFVYNNYNDQFKHELNECENDLLEFCSYFPYKKDFSFPLRQYIRDIIFAAYHWGLFDQENEEKIYLSNKILFIIIRIFEYSNYEIFEEFETIFKRVLKEYDQYRKRFCYRYDDFWDSYEIWRRYIKPAIRKHNFIENIPKLNKFMNL